MTISQTSPSPVITCSEDKTAQPKAGNQRRWTTVSSFRVKHFVLPLALIVVLVIGWAAIGGGNTGIFGTARGDSQPAVGSAPQRQVAAAGIGTKVHDGTFEFVVTGVERPGKTFPGKSHTVLTAHSEFVIVRVNVTNIGDEARRLDCQCQYLLNDKGQAISPSSAILYTPDALKFVQMIDPRNTVYGAPVVFDVVPGTRLVSIELHGSPTSQGVQVSQVVVMTRVRSVLAARLRIRRGSRDHARTKPGPRAQDHPRGY